MKFGIQKDVTITSKGQLTLPVSIRKALKLGVKRKVRVAVTREGLITMRPLPDVMSLFGALKSHVPHVPYDPNEKRKAREAMGRHAARKSR
jgi:bifunctional DNA-binding transcriptional regulator/antitoxin component of YhaV-PrlF toxin-antitoxin module